MDKFLQIPDTQTLGCSTSETMDFDISKKAFNQVLKKIPI